jgi:TPR repeat protein
VKDVTKAATLFAKACDRKDSNGCVASAVTYLQGAGVEPDRPKAAALLGTACNLGSGLGCFDLAQIMASTDSARYDLKTDLTAARAVFERSCGLNEPR